MKDEEEEMQDSPILCISDLHGNLGLLEKALREGLERAGRSDLEVVLLGDYCDNGPEVKELLEYLSTEKWRDEFPDITLQCIAGNHDISLLLAHSPGIFHSDPNFRRRGFTWWERSTTLFCNRGGETTKQYDSKSQQEFVDNFPPHHFEFLQSLPWSITIAQYIFVHAGLRVACEESVEAQLGFLSRKNLSDLKRHVYARGGYGLPDQLCNKAWAELNDPNWEYVVVTGHNKYSTKSDAPDFVASHRIGFHSCACQILVNPSLPLHCALLPRCPVGTSTTEPPPHLFSVSYCVEKGYDTIQKFRRSELPKRGKADSSSKLNASDTLSLAQDDDKVSFFSIFE